MAAYGGEIYLSTFINKLRVVKLFVKYYLRGLTYRNGSNA